MYAKSQKAFLLFLAEAVPNQVKLILRHLTSNQKAAIQEVIVNLFRGTLSLTEAQLLKLRKYRRQYRRAARSSKVKLLQVPLVLLLQFAKETIAQL
jgi:hypothetical protein